MSVNVWREYVENSYCQVLRNLLGLGEFSREMASHITSAAIRGGSYAESSTRSDHDTDTHLHYMRLIDRIPSEHDDDPLFVLPRNAGR